MSTGKVSNIIKVWKRGIGISGIEETRDFAIKVKKSGISVAQCAEGYRMYQIIKNLGVVDGDFYGDITTKEDFGIGGYSNRDRINPMEFSTFVQDIYLNCKKLGISPDIVLSVITDLLTTFEGFCSNPCSNLDYANNTNLILKSNLNGSHADPSFKQKSGDCGSLTQTQIPFISKVNRYIAQKKKEIIDLEKNNKILKDENKKLEYQLNQKNFDLNLTKQEEKYVISFIDWFYDTKRELRDNYSIDIVDFKIFARAVTNFKNNGFNISMIMDECTSSSSLTKKIKTMKEDNQILGSQIIGLNKSVSSLENKANYHRQTMDVCYQLKGMGLGLHQLKQLHGTLLEIADVNNIPAENAVSKFLKDVEDQYDNKLGFENIVNEKKDEIVLATKELKNSRQSLWFTPLIGPSLYNLFQKGISEQDIIGISQLVEICTINTDFNNSGIGLGNKNKNKNSSPIDTTNNGNKITSRSEYWKQFISELKKYGDIKLAIKEQQEKRDTAAKDIDNMQKQKQEISVGCQNGIYLINELYHKMAYFKEFMNRFNRDIDNKIKAYSMISGPLPIFKMYDG
ncbi:MAG: hypothetical protein M3Z01_03430 [Thermoproteota archaeon]|nr:hypothetical protein [Thermoproteota archaeon]